MWDLPVSVEIDDQKYPIRNECDYRVVLDAMRALNDNELSDEEKVQCALYIFYENLFDIEDEHIEKAIKEMFRIINGGEVEEQTDKSKPVLMDWERDFSYIAPPISRVLGYDIRTPNRYCHFWTFIGGYMEIGECAFSNIVSIRSKRLKGEKLEKWESEYYNEHKKIIDLPQKLTSEDKEWLESDL